MPARERRAHRPPRLPRSAGMGACLAHARCRRFRALSARGATSLIRRGRRTPTVRGIPGAREAPNKCVLCRTHTTSVAVRSPTATQSGLRRSRSRRHDSGRFSDEPANPVHRRRPRSSPVPRGRAICYFVFCNGTFRASRAPGVPATRVARRETGSEPGRPPTELAATDPRAGPLRPVSK